MDLFGIWLLGLMFTWGFADDIGDTWWKTALLIMLWPYALGCELRDVLERIAKGQK